METWLSAPPESAVMVKLSVSRLYFMVTFASGSVLIVLIMFCRVVSLEKVKFCR